LKELTSTEVKHKSFLRSRSIQKSIEKRKNNLAFRVDHFSDIVSFNLKEFVDKSDFSKVNHLRISRANSLEHEVLKSEIFVKLVHCGLNVLVEPLLLDRSMGRPDILVLDTVPCIAYEILVSEKESSIKRKDEKYPFKIVTVKVEL